LLIYILLTRSIEAYIMPRTKLNLKEGL
jgi:hypothetical protein